MSSFVGTWIKWSQKIKIHIQLWKFYSIQSMLNLYHKYAKRVLVYIYIESFHHFKDFMVKPKSVFSHEYFFCWLTGQCVTVISGRKHVFLLHLCFTPAIKIDINGIFYIHMLWSLKQLCTYWINTWWLCLHWTFFFVQIWQKIWRGFRRDLVLVYLVNLQW